MIVIVDFGMGNLGSIQNMLRRIGVASLISSSKQDIANATKIILPGVGSFDQAMINIRSLGLEQVLKQKAVEEKIPFLGICLGMQLLAHKSEEGIEAGLGFFDAEIIKFSFDKSQSLKIPHMGWNIANCKNDCYLFKDMPSEEMRFYFVHSYYVSCKDTSDIAATTIYGFPFTSAVQKGNICGVQFHPEKSHKYGLQLLKNFAEKKCLIKE